MLIQCALECSSYTQVAMAIQTGRYAGFLPEFAQGTAFGAGSASLQHQTKKALRYERTLTLAYREATMRSRPVVEQLIPTLKAQLGRLL